MTPRWRCFDVEDYASYVEVQSESALRSIASRFAYDHGHEERADSCVGSTR